MGKGTPKSALEAAQVPRKYVHFDVPLSKVVCKNLVTDPAAVSRHSFYPFLRHDIVRSKLKRVGPGRPVKSVKIRDIRYAAHADAAIYTYYNCTLTALYEKRLTALDLSDTVIAFRALSKSNVDFAKEAFDWINSHRPCVALGFDVKDFFGSLDHGLLKATWNSLLGTKSLPDDHFAVFKSLSRHASVELIAARNKLGISRTGLDRIKRLCEASAFRNVIRGSDLVRVNQSGHGIPQGSPISAALSNIYMLPFDTAVKAKIDAMGGLYRRYCDDILIVVSPADVAEVHKLVEQELAALKLAMQPAKTLVCRFDIGKADNPLQYLGLVYDGTQVFLRASGVARYYAKMREGIKQLKYAKKMDGGTRLLVQRRRCLMRRYTEHTPDAGRSYFKYVKMAARKNNSPAIKRQFKSHLKRFKRLVEE